MKIPNLTYDNSTKIYRYRNPLTGKRKSLGRDWDVASQQALQLNEVVRKIREAATAGEDGIITLTGTIEHFINDELPRRPWKEDTRKNYLGMLRRYQREFPRVLLRQITRIDLSDWLEQFRTADTYNGHRYLFCEIWDYAISRGWCEVNEPGKTLKRSTSQMIPENKKVRKSLTLEEWKIIHETAPAFIQTAMELSLLTLQAVREVSRMSSTDIRGGMLYLIRQKTEYQSDMAFIRIPITPELQSVFNRSRQSGLHCPTFVHRKPERRQSSHPGHPYSVFPKYLSKAYARHRNSTEVFSHLTPAQRPPFHEIRGLGSRCMRERGISEKVIQELMTHSDRRATQVYLSGGELTDNDYKSVELPSLGLF